MIAAVLIILSDTEFIVFHNACILYSTRDLLGLINICIVLQLGLQQIVKIVDYYYYLGRSGGGVREWSHCALGGQVDHSPVLTCAAHVSEYCVSGRGNTRRGVHCSFDCDKENTFTFK